MTAVSSKKPPGKSKRRAKQRPLSERARLFAEHYSGDGVHAARLAGYTGTPEALSVTASRLLRDPRVRALIEKRGGSLPPLAAGGRSKSSSATAPAEPAPKSARELYEQILANPTARLNHRMDAADKLERLKQREVASAASDEAMYMPKLRARMHELLAARAKRMAAQRKGERPLRIVGSPKKKTGEGDDDE